MKMITEENQYKSLKDTININLRKRNYSIVENKAKQFLTQYPDSIESAGMIPKLYVSSLNLDSSGNHIVELKTYLESIITGNPQNTSLVRSAFYHIQKCKVKTGQYQSALDGFQYIMTQYPYTYEGLIASWDYAATYLLMGSGGSKPDDNNPQFEELTIPADTIIKKLIKNDLKTELKTNNGNNEQLVKQLYENINQTMTDERLKQETKMRTLEKTIETSKDINQRDKAKKELSKMKQINEAVKIKRPDKIKTHIKIISDDIKKIFGGGQDAEASSLTGNNTPQTYELSQNYPNPFNPVTKINYTLPKEGKVKLIIYDILGREMKILINNEFRTSGRYQIEFNASGLSSGVYFYRLLVNDGNDFIDVKKMVLLK